MKKIIILWTFILITNIFAKHCYTVQHKTSCYKRYFNISNIHKPILGIKYYKGHDKKIYSFEDNIEIRFKRIGAILTIEDDFDIKFIDKDKKDTFLYKLNNKDELFSIITNLNTTSYITKAKPIRHRKLTKDEYQSLQNAKKASMERRLDNYKSPKNSIKEKAEKAKQKEQAKAAKNRKETSNLKKGVESDLMW